MEIADWQGGALDAARCVAVLCSEAGRAMKGMVRCMQSG